MLRNQHRAPWFGRHGIPLQFSQAWQIVFFFKLKRHQSHVDQNLFETKKYQTLRLLNMLSSLSRYFWVDVFPFTLRWWYVMWIFPGGYLFTYTNKSFKLETCKLQNHYYHKKQLFQPSTIIKLPSIFYWNFQVPLANITRAPVDLVNIPVPWILWKMKCPCLFIHFRHIIHLNSRGSVGPEANVVSRNFTQSAETYAAVKLDHFAICWNICCSLNYLRV